MKYLLMLLLFAGICQGQEKDCIPIYYDSTKYEIGESPGNGTIGIYDNRKENIGKVQSIWQRPLDTRPITRQDLIDYFQECTPEWRLNKLIKDSVWILPIRTDWKEVLYKEPTFTGFKEWMEKRK